MVDRSLICGTPHIAFHDDNNLVYEHDAIVCHIVSIISVFSLAIDIMVYLTATSTTNPHE